MAGSNPQKVYKKGIKATKNCPKWSNVFYAFFAFFMHFVQAFTVFGFPSTSIVVF